MKKLVLILAASSAFAAAPSRSIPNYVASSQPSVIVTTPPAPVAPPVAIILPPPPVVSPDDDAFYSKARIFQLNNQKLAVIFRLYGDKRAAEIFDARAQAVAEFYLGVTGKPLTPPPL